jgi:Mn2+/Fe2+ NRAMP family transporter
MDWPEGLSRRFAEARGFYGVIILSTLVGLLLNFIGVNPMKALVFTAVFNGVAAVPLLLVVALMNGDQRVLGPWTGGPLSQILVWVTVVVMTLAAGALIFTLVAPSGRPGGGAT